MLTALRRERLFGVASPFIHKVGDEGQVSDQSGRLAQRTLSGGFRHAPTLNRQIRTAAASLNPTSVVLDRVTSPGRIRTYALVNRQLF